MDLTLQGGSERNAMCSMPFLKIALNITPPSLAKRETTEVVQNTNEPNSPRTRWNGTKAY